MDGMEFIFTNNSGAVVTELENKVGKMLEDIGQKVVGFAKKNISTEKRVDTGQYRNSITHRVKADEKAVYVGSNLMTAVYNELGTGKYATDGKGRPGYWVYVVGGDESYRSAHRSTERKIYTLQQAQKIVAIMNKKFKKDKLPYRAYYTQGMKPIHALERAASEHNQAYKNIIKKNMKT